MNLDSREYQIYGVIILIVIFVSVGIFMTNHPKSSQNSDKAMTMHYVSPSVHENGENDHPLAKFPWDFHGAPLDGNYFAYRHSYPVSMYGSTHDAKYFPPLY